MSAFLSGGGGNAASGAGALANGKAGGKRKRGDEDEEDEDASDSEDEEEVSVGVCFDISAMQGWMDGRLVEVCLKTSKECSSGSASATGHFEDRLLVLQPHTLLAHSHLCPSSISVQEADEASRAISRARAQAVEALVGALRLPAATDDQRLQVRAAPPLPVLFVFFCEPGYSCVHARCQMMVMMVMVISLV